ncbi:MAG: RNase adapter RapZ [Alphaproteobacteria bacterium]
MARRVFILSSLSGAGRTTALAVLSDLGFIASDSVPVELWPEFLAQSGESDVALGWPLRPDQQDQQPAIPVLPDGLSLCHVFLTADLEILRRRYNETRRVHPFDRGEGLLDALEAEKAASEPRRAMADEVIDTTGVKLTDLRATIAALAEPKTDQLQIRSLSFSYRAGIPMDADMVFDVRWLRNPHYDPDLRPRTGKDSEVAAYIRADEKFEEFISYLRGLLTLTVDRQKQEGKVYFTVAFGCTGGKHRSVFFAEMAAEWLSELGYTVSAVHRDTGRY